MRDRRVIYAAAFLRAVAIGLLGVLLGIHLDRLGLLAGTASLVIAAGLAGGALASVVATLAADRIGRRAFLVGLGILGALGGVGLALSSSAGVLAAVAFIGMANGAGRDRGAALVLETAMLPATVDDRRRTRAFAWYSVLQDGGHALGSALAGLPVWLRPAGVAIESASVRGGIVLYAVILLAASAVYLAASPALESTSMGRPAPVSPESRRAITRISALFALDSLGGGLITTSFVALFFARRFGVGPAEVGMLFAAARVANALSHLAAAWLAGRIGLINTMVFTHIPSSLLLVTVAMAPSFPIAALLLILREGLVEMDVPTRQSYVAAMVRPEERTAAAGVTHLVRMGGWAAGPSLAGLLLDATSAPLAVPLIIGSGMKVLYDVLLWVSFRKRRPPEEVR